MVDVLECFQVGNEFLVGSLSDVVVYFDAADILYEVQGFHIFVLFVDGVVQEVVE